MIPDNVNTPTLPESVPLVGTDAAWNRGFDGTGTVVAILDTGVGHLQVAGVAVSVILGGLALIPLTAMARRAWDDRVATIAAILYAFLPAVIDVEIEPMTEGTFMFFFLSAMAVGWSALGEKSSASRPNASRAWSRSSM